MCLTNSPEQKCIFLQGWGGKLPFSTVYMLMLVTPVWWITFWIVYYRFFFFVPSVVVSHHCVLGPVSYHFSLFQYLWSHNTVFWNISFFKKNKRNENMVLVLLLPAGGQRAALGVLLDSTLASAHLSMLNFSRSATLSHPSVPLFPAPRRRLGVWLCALVTRLCPERCVAKFSAHPGMNGTTQRAYDF